MNIFIRFTLFLIPSFAVLLALRNAPMTGAHPDRIAGYENETFDSDGRMHSAAMRSVFWEQRLMGNPDVDIVARLWNANEAVLKSRPVAFDKSTSSANTWQELGPWNIAGRMRAVAMDPVNDKVMYAGAAAGGVWKTTDQGNNWAALTDFFPLLPVGAIAIDPNNPNRILAGTGEPCVDPVLYVTRSNYTPTYLRSLGILKSEDAGASWTLLPWISPNNAAAHRIAINPISADTFLVASIMGLIKTTNGGKNWLTVNSGNITDLFYQPGRPSRVYIAIGYDDGGNSNGVYVSDAGGDRYSFRKLAKNFPASDSCGRILIGTSAANPNRIYAAVALNRTMAGSSENDFLTMLTSDDGGETWERKRNAISNSCTSGQAYFDMAMAVSPTDPNLVFVGGLDVYRSTNGAFTFSKLTDWTRQPTDVRYAHADHHSLVFKPGDGNVVINGNDGGISVSSDKGNTWAQRLGKLGTIQFYSCAYDPANPTYSYGGTQDNGSLGRTFPDNSQWFEVFGGDGGNVAIDPQKSTLRYVVTTPASGGRLAYRLNGSIQTALDRGLNSGADADRFNWIAPLMLHPNDRTRLYTASQYVYAMRNPDAGTPTWSIISPDLAAPYYIVTDLAVSPTNKDYMYAVTSNGKAWVTATLTSLDATWTAINGGLPARWLTDVTVDWDDPETAYIAASGYGTGHAFKTTNRGQNWVNITGDLPDIPASAIVRSKTDPNTLFLGSDLGVWYTVNGGAHWERYGEGLPNCVVFDMKMTPDNRLLVGTHGRGMWTTSTVTSSELPESTSASGFSVGQGYPNPASTETSFALTLSRRMAVTTEIFNSSGRRVASLTNAQFGPGVHHIPIETTTLLNGTYFCRMLVDGKSVIRKFVIVR